MRLARVDPQRPVDVELQLQEGARTLVGTTARVKVLRDGKEQVIPVKIGERPSDEMLARREPEPKAKPGAAKAGPAK